MDYFRKYIAGQPGDSQPTGADTVERLCERVRSSTLLDDRRDAVRGLKALSRKFCLEVGTQGMDILIEVLQNDRSDTEITGYALETLCNVMSNEMPEDENEIPFNLPEDLGGQFTEMFITKSDNISVLLSLLEEYDFHVRWPTVKLLTILLTNRSRSLQEFILVSPMGVSKLMDLLSDSREVIRNDALLLLTQLTKGNASIQKIVAFENGFERLLEIMHEEGNSDGGIVVEDCLLLLLNLLTSNPSNQTFFKEGSFIQRLTPYFQINTDDIQVGWSAQKVTNIHLMLQLIRTLVSPNNPHQLTSASQTVMFSCGLLQQLSSILMTSGVPADVLTETINTVSEIIRGNQANQEFFASVMAPSTPPRPAIVVLLMSMVNEKQPFVLRCAVLYCFQSFLYKNDIGQMQIVQTLLPTSADANTITAGQLLCGGLFSADSLSNWFAAVALLHAILDNPKQKEQLLRVQLATSVGNPPVSLLQQCCNMLSQGGKTQTKIGLLMIISVWLSDCSIAVAHFLNNPTNVPYLITQITSGHGEEQEILVQGMCAFVLGLCVQYSDDQNDNFNKESLERIIKNRIGFESFHDKLQQVSKSEQYTRAAKIAHLNFKHPNEVIFDHAFTKLFKECEYEMVQGIQPEVDGKAKKKATSLKDHENIVDSYKQVIKEQDGELQKLKADVDSLNLHKKSSLSELEQLRSQVQELKDQNAVLKLHRGLTPPQTIPSENDTVSNSHDAELERLQMQLHSQNSQIEALHATIAEKDAILNKQENDMAVEENKENYTNNIGDKYWEGVEETVKKQESEIEQLKETCTQKDIEIESLKLQISHSINSTSLEDEMKAIPHADVMQLQAEIDQLTQALTGAQSDLNESSRRADLAETACLQLKAQLDTQPSNEDMCRGHEEKITKLTEENESLRLEVDSVKSEQDDLLVLMADQDSKLSSYKSQLKNLGQPIEDDDEDEDEIDEDGYEDDP